MSILKIRLIMRAQLAQLKSRLEYLKKAFALSILSTQSYCWSLAMKSLVKASVTIQRFYTWRLLTSHLADSAFKTLMTGAQWSYERHAACEVRSASMLPHDGALKRFKALCEVAYKNGPHAAHPGILAALGINIIAQARDPALSTWFSVNFCKAFHFDSLPTVIKNQLDDVLKAI